MPQPAPARGRRVLAALLLLLLLLAVRPGAAQTPAAAVPVTIHYQQRPPYYVHEPGGEPRGLVVDPLKRVLARAGLAPAWALTPSQRQLLLIEQGQGPDCGLGWFRNPQREQLGRFSAQPLYRDQPIGMLARRGSALREGMSMREAVLQAPAELLVKTGFSYGPELDALIAARSASRGLVSGNGDMPTLIRMLQAGRADWMPLAPEEAQVWLGSGPPAPLPAEQFQLLHFADAPPGLGRYLYCNKAVPQSWLDRLDAALAAGG
ncbi:MAG TPA: transporter substrate-binding domain-containing protein [Roseateles sp.]|nr:transporter substrate-binding domain-containing protein [Roseateles sp.]